MHGGRSIRATLDIHNVADNRFRLCLSPLRGKREWGPPCKLHFYRKLTEALRFGVRTALQKARRLIPGADRTSIQKRGDKIRAF